MSAFAPSLILAQEALARSDFNVAQNISFAIVAAVMLYSAFRMVTTGNVVHAALYLMIVLAGTAALFILLGLSLIHI